MKMNKCPNCGYLPCSIIASVQHSIDCTVSLKEAMIDLELELQKGDRLFINGVDRGTIGKNNTFKLKKGDGWWFG